MATILRQRLIVRFRDCTYKTKGVCSREINFEVEDNKVKNVQFVGGCSGNTQGVARLIDGMDIDEALSRIEGIQCAFSPTS